MPLKFWDEAFLTATHLINLLPSKVVDYKTPTELLLHEAPDYSSLRVFGCACWPNLRPFNSRKLEFRSKRCAFLGYSSLHKGFKCLDIPTGRVYISHDVIFDEGVFPFASLHENAGKRLRHEISLLPEHLLGSYSGHVDSTDRYYANDTDPNEHASDVIDEQEVAGDEYEPAEEVSIENRALGRAQQASGVQPLRDKPSAESGADSGGMTGASAEPDTIHLGSGAGAAAAGTAPAETAPAAVPREADSSPGRSRTSGTHGVPGQDAALPCTTGSDGGGFSAASGSNAPATSSEPEIQRVKTRSQSGISRPKVYTDGTVRYANFSATGEPTSLDEALSDPNWKKAMQEEITTLHKNET
jgi:hypothetical protein